MTAATRQAETTMPPPPGTHPAETQCGTGFALSPSRAEQAPPAMQNGAVAAPAGVQDLHGRPPVARAADE